jgi:hypothetical protein
VTQNFFDLFAFDSPPAAHLPMVEFFFQKNDVHSLNQAI